MNEISFISEITMIQFRLQRFQDLINFNGEIKKSIMKLSFAYLYAIFIMEILILILHILKFN